MEVPLQRQKLGMNRNMSVIMVNISSEASSLCTVQVQGWRQLTHDSSTLDLPRFEYSRSCTLYLWSTGHETPKGFVLAWGSRLRSPSVPPSA